MVDADVDAAPKAGFASVLLLMDAVAAVFVAVELVAVIAAVVAVVLATPTTAAKIRDVDANPPAAAQALVASNRYSPVAREPRFASQSDVTAN